MWPCLWLPLSCNMRCWMNACMQVNARQAENDTSILQRSLQAAQSALNRNQDLQQSLKQVQQGFSEVTASAHERLDAAAARLHDISIPDIQLPQISVPNIQLPQISAPAIELPQLHELRTAASSLTQGWDSQAAAPGHPSILNLMLQQLHDAQQTGSFPSLPKLEAPGFSMPDVSQLPSDLAAQLPDLQQLEAQLQQLLPDLPQLPSVNVDLTGDNLTGIFQSWNTPPAVWATGIDWTPAGRLVAGAWGVLTSPFQVRRSTNMECIFVLLSITDAC